MEEVQGGRSLGTLISVSAWKKAAADSYPYIGRGFPCRDLHKPTTIRSSFAYRFRMQRIYILTGSPLIKDKRCLVHYLSRNSSVQILFIKHLLQLVMLLRCVPVPDPVRREILNVIGSTERGRDLAQPGETRVAVGNPIVP